MASRMAGVENLYCSGVATVRELSVRAALEAHNVVAEVPATWERVACARSLRRCMPGSDRRRRRATRRSVGPAPEVAARERVEEEVEVLPTGWVRQDDRPSVFYRRRMCRQDGGRGPVRDRCLRGATWQRLARQQQLRSE